MGKKILLIDDERDVTDLIEYKLQKEGYRVKVLNDPLQIIGQVRDFAPDLLLLDIMMPDLNGIQICRMIRNDPLFKDLPIIFLTAKVEAEDRVKGLESGADDYICKPFDTNEVLLRVKSVLKRISAKRRTSPAQFQVGKVLVDIEQHEVLVNGNSIDLTATEFRLLKLLMEEKGRVQNREALLLNVWNYDSDIETRTIDTHVRRLRKKLGWEAHILETIRGVGYRVIDKDK